MNKEKLLEIINNPILKRISEAMFTIAFCLYFYANCAVVYNIVFVKAIDALADAVLFLLPVIVVLQWITHLDRKRDIIIGAVVIVFFKIIVLLGVCRIDARYFPLLIAASIGVDYKKVLRACVVLWGIVIVAVILATAVSGGGNTVYATKARIRSGGGLGYVTDAASWVLYMAMYFYITSEYETDYIALILAGVSALAARFYFDSNTSTFMSVLLFVLIIYSRIEVRFWKKKAVKIISVILNLLALTLIPITTGFLIIAAILYDKGNTLMAQIDKLIHWRIKLTSQALTEYGIKPFGVNFGLVGSSVPGMKAYNYNYLDSSFVNIMIRFGWVIALIIFIIWTFEVFKAMSGNRRRFVLVSIIIAIHSFEEQHFFELRYNPILWMPLAYGVNSRFASYGAYLKRKEKRAASENVETKDLLKQSLVAWAVRAVLILISLLASPVIFARFRTLYDIKEELGSASSFEDARYLAIFFFAALVAIIWGAGRIAKKLYKKEKLIVDKKKDIVAPAVVGGAFLIALAVYVAAGIGIHIKSDVYAARIEADKAAIDVILDAAEYPVYSDEYTEGYKKAFSGIKYSRYTGADLVRQLDCTIITDKDNEVVQYFNRGCSYAQISDYSAIYTTDNAVEEALAAAGYHVTGYFNLEKEVDLGVTFTTNSMTVTPGDYTLAGSISFAPEEGKEYSGNAQIAVISIADADSEEKIKVRIRDLDENGNYNYELKFKTRNEGMTFSITSSYGKELTASAMQMTVDGGETTEPTVYAVYNGSSAIYAGKYVLDLALLADNYQDEPENESIGKIEYTTSGDRTGNKPIYVGGFDDQKAQTVELTLSSGGEAFDFNITIDNKFAPRISSFTYIQKPDYDIHYTYDDEGYVVRAEYYDLEGNKTIAPDGYFAIEYENDKDGNQTVVRYLDENNERVLIPSRGYAEAHRIYNKLGYLIYESYFGADGEPITRADGFAAYSNEVDTYGNATQVRYYDGEGNLVDISAGYAVVDRRFDDEKRVIYETFTCADGSKYVAPQGYSGCRYEYDEAGNKSVIVYLDENDKPILTTWGYAEVHKEFDEMHRVTVESYYGTDGEVMETASGYATVVNEYDDNGNLAAIRYFGIDTSTGYTEIRREYDSKNRVIYEGKFNSDGEGIIMSGQYSAYRKTYDDAGNVDSIIYYGTDGNLVMIGGEYAEVHYKYDDSKRVIYESFFDGEGNPVLRGGGKYHGLGYEYDEAGNRNVTRYYDSADALVLIDGQYAEVHRTFDENKRTATESYFGLSGEKVVLSAGYHMVSYGYDEENNVNVIKYYDLDGNPMLINSGVHEIRRTFNEVRKITREEYYGTDGNPIANTAGAAVVTREYYDDGSLIGEYKYDIDGNLIEE